MLPPQVELPTSSLMVRGSIIKECDESIVINYFKSFISWWMCSNNMHRSKILDLLKKSLVMHIETLDS